MKMTFAIVLLSAAAAVCTAAETADEENPSTVASVLRAYQEAVSRHDWRAAERCLASELREMLKDAMANRTFFDQYVTEGFRTKTLELLPANRVTKQAIADLEKRVPAPSIPGPGPQLQCVTVAAGGGATPWMAQCWFVEEKDGWKLTLDPDRIKSKDDFFNWYDNAIPSQSRGKAKKLEAERPSTRPQAEEQRR